MTTTTTSRQQSAADAPARAAAAPNTVLADLREAIETYAEEYLRIEMYDVNPEGGVLNVGDTATFRLRVRNAGPLDVRNFTVLLSGTSQYVRVGKHGWTNGQATYGSAVVGKVQAHMAADEWIDVPDTEHDHFHFWVHQETSRKIDLVTVTVKDWDLDLLHLLENHTTAGAAPHFVYRDKVLQQ